LCLLAVRFTFTLGKKRKRGDAEDLISKIAKIDEEAEKRAEEREKRWLESEDRREKERREHEDRHAQMMMSMFSGFMTQMSSMMMSQPLIFSKWLSALRNPTFPSQDFMPNYNSNYSSVPFTNPNSVDTEPELDPNMQPDK